MPFSSLQSTTKHAIFIIGAIGTLITGIGYLTPVIDYASNLHRAAVIVDSLELKMQRYDKHLRDVQEEQLKKQKSFAVGLRSSEDTHQLMYVDEDGGVYRAWLDSETKRYFYYNVNGQPIFCYTKQPKNNMVAQPALRVQPLVLPDTSRIDTSFITE